MTLPRPPATGLLVESQAGVTTLWLARPERLNAIDAATARALLAALQSAEADPAVRVIVLRGQGRAFCAGRDIREPPDAEILEQVQAERWGLVWSLVDDVALEAETARIAARLAPLDPAVASRFERVLNTVGLGDFQQALAVETRMQLELQQRQPPP